MFAGAAPAATMNNTHHTTPSPLATALLVVQALGTGVIDAVRFVLHPDSLVRRLPVVRAACVATMLILIAQSDVAFSVQFGGDAATSAREADLQTSQPSRTLLAGFFAAGEAPARAAGGVALDDAAALAVIERFEQVARAEEQRFGIPAEVLLAAAAVASGDAAAQSGNNYFSEALDGDFASAWESWRAMSLSVAAEPGAAHASTVDDWVAVTARLYPDAPGVAEAMTYAIARYTL